MPVKIPMVGGGRGVADKKVTPGLRSIYLQNSMTSFNMRKERKKKESGKRLGRRDGRGRNAPWIVNLWGDDYQIIFPMGQALSWNLEESTGIFMHISLRLRGAKWCAWI